MTWLALIGLWILASVLAGVLIGRGINAVRGGTPPTITVGRVTWTDRSGVQWQAERP